MRRTDKRQGRKELGNCKDIITLSLLYGQINRTLKQKPEVGEGEMNKTEEDILEKTCCMNCTKLEVEDDNGYPCCMCKELDIMISSITTFYCSEFEMNNAEQQNRGIK